MPLHERPCIPPKDGSAPLQAAEQAPLLAELQDWIVQEGSILEKSWRFADFAGALAWLNRAAALCEEAQHHADFELAWGRVSARIWTHSLGGLSEADFVLAARFDQL